ncbi:hypothetical protein Tco_0319790 [Tanacetum coccineum]
MLGKKRAGKEQRQESSKRQRMEDDKETDEHEEVDETELKKHLVIVKDDDIAIDAIPLATKPPVIVEYKLLKEGIMVHYQLIRADGSSKRYSSIIRMLQGIEREDLQTLWKLVKTKRGDTRPEDEHERVLSGVTDRTQKKLICRRTNQARSRFLGTGLGSGPSRQDTILGDRPTQTRFERLSKQSNNPHLSGVNTPGSGEDRLKIMELMEIYTKLSDRVLSLENVKTAQDLEITSLKKRVKKLEKKKKARTSQLKRRLFKVRIKSSAEKSLGDQEDVSKQGRNEDQDEDISWFQEDAKTQGRYDQDIDITTVSAPITTAGVSVSTTKPSTPPTTTTTNVIEDEDLIIA